MFAVLACAISTAQAQEEIRFPRRAAAREEQAQFRSGLLGPSNVTQTEPPPENAVAAQQPAALLAQPATANQTQVTDFPAPADVNSLLQDNSPGQNSFLQSIIQSQLQSSDLGSEFYRTNEDFSQGLVVHGKNVVMKIGGYVKLDLIYDLNAIDATDLFDVASIPVGASQRTNSRMHARQTRLNFDTRWQTDAGILKTFAEGDFFSRDDQFRLRHAYGQLGRFLGGKTFTTFANIDAAPATLDFEGSVSAITTRRAQIRWTQPLFNRDDLQLALALEDPFTVLERPPGDVFSGETRTISPDFVARLRRTGPRGNVQFAGIVRQLGFQPTGQSVLGATAWGLNFSQVARLGRDDRFYWQINYGDGIASLVGDLPDIVATSSSSAELLGYFGWMIGATHDWNSRFSSNLTFAESHFRHVTNQPPSDINNLTYVAANVIWTPLDRVQVGLEYLYGKREDISGASGLANRLQFSIFYFLP